MPHQLRRIITINIKNPKDGLPSGRIAEMDPRGGVLAVGINGVGKDIPNCPVAPHGIVGG